MASPKELASRIRQKVAPAPQPPKLAYRPWSPPDDMPSDKDARLEGARALANSALYRGPSEDELRAAQERDNAIAEAFARQGR